MEENPKFESKYSLTILENVSLKIEPSKKEVDIEK